MHLFTSKFNSQHVYGVCKIFDFPGQEVELIIKCFLLLCNVWKFFVERKKIMTNVEQAKQQIMELVLNSGLTFGEIMELPGYCIDLLWQFPVGPNVKFADQSLGGEKNDT